jgi:Lrp/AsnC family leucine-responsive transcriptional regulator
MSTSAAKNATVDEIDRDILSELTRDGRVSFTDLAPRVGLSPNAVAERVRRLERLGVIRGYTAELDRRTLGTGLEAYIDVKLRAETPADRFEAAVERIPGIEQMILTTGSSDYSIRVACKDQADLVRLIEALRAAVPIAETYTRLILRERNLPLTSEGRSVRRDAGTSG